MQKTWLLSVLCSSLLFAPGCASLSSVRPVPILIRDAETKQPISAAEVRFADPLVSSSGMHLGSAAATHLSGSNGVARLCASPNDTVLEVEANAAGYLAASKTITSEVTRAIDLSHYFENLENRPAAVVLELFAEPRPSVELVVPVGYRGAVKVEVQANDASEFAVGQRDFSFEVAPSGEIVIDGPAFFAHLIAPDFRARYADGTPISRNGQESDVGLWWLRAERNTQHFIIGTRKEYEDAVRALEKQGPKLGRSSGPGEKSEGQGRKGRRGGRSGSSGMSP